MSNSRYRQGWVQWDQPHGFCDCGGKYNELGAACVVLRKQNKTNTYRLKMLGYSDGQRHWLPELLAAAGDRCSRFRPPAIFVLILCAQHSGEVKRDAFLPSPSPRAHKEKRISWKFKWKVSL